MIHGLKISHVFSGLLLVTYSIYGFSSTQISGFYVGMNKDIYSSYKEHHQKGRADVNKLLPGTSIRLGYQITPYTSIVTGFRQLGDINYPSPMSKIITSSLSGIPLSLELTQAITENLKLHENAGALFYQNSIKNDNNMKISHRGTAYIYGIGLEYTLNNRWSININYQNTMKIKSMSNHFHQNALSLGFTYRFTESPPQIIPLLPQKDRLETINVPSSDKNIQAYNYLSSKVHINFQNNQLKLTEQNKVELDKFVQDLKQKKIIGGKVMLFGYLDFIKNTISIKTIKTQMQSIKDYLISKGMVDKNIAFYFKNSRTHKDNHKSKQNKVSSPAKDNNIDVISEVVFYDHFIQSEKNQMNESNHLDYLLDSNMYIQK